jgi:hypothetical protein
MPAAVHAASRAAAGLALFLLLAVPAQATPLHNRLAPSGPSVQALSPEGDEGGGESSEDILRANEEWAEARTAPADSVDAAAFVEARNAASALPVFGGSWILRSGDGGRTFQPVGGTQLQNHLVGRLVFDGQGNVYAATSYGLYKRRAGDLTSSWTLVLRPGVGPFGTTFVNDVVVRPGIHAAAFWPTSAGGRAPITTASTTRARPVSRGRGRSSTLPGSTPTTSAARPSPTPRMARGSTRSSNRRPSSWRPTRRPATRTSRASSCPATARRAARTS